MADTVCISIYAGGSTAQLLQGGDLNQSVNLCDVAPAYE